MTPAFDAAAIRRPALLVLLLVVLPLACGAPPPTPTPRPAVEAPPTLARDSLAEPWRIEPASRSFRHEIRLDAELTSVVDSAERRDTLHVVLEATWSRLAGTAPSRISGLLTAYRLASGDTVTPQPLPQLLLPIPFGSVAGGAGEQERLTAPRPEDCTAAAAATQALREVLVSPPRTLTAGLEWGDSSRYVICRDSIALTVNSVRHFRVLGAAMRGAERVVRVQRNSTTTMAGEGTQFGEALSISADGTGTMLLELLLAGGAPLAGEGESDLRMTMRGRRRTQELRQHTRIVITTP